MAETIEGLVLKLSADSSGLRTELGKVTTAVDSMTKGVEKSTTAIASSFSSLKTTVLGVAAAIVSALAGGALAHLVRASMESIDANAKLADRLELTADEFASLKLAAELANSSVEGVTKSATFLRRSMANAASGNEEVIASFAKLGLSADELKNMKIDAALGLVSDKLYGMKDAAERTALTMAILGRGAGEMDAFMRDGSKGIAEAREQVEEMGGALSRVDAHQVEKANDSITSFSAVVTRVVEQLSTELAPYITVVFDTLRNYLVDTIKGFGGLEAAGSKFVDLMAEIAGWAMDIGSAFSALGSLLKTVIIVIAGSAVHVLSDIVTAFEWVGRVGSNVWSAIGASFDVVVAVLKAGWAGIKYTILSALENITSRLATFIGYMADAAGVFDEELATSIRAGASSMLAATGKMAEGAQKDMYTLRDAAVEAGDTAKTAISNIFNTEGIGDNPMLDSLATAFDEAGLASADAMIASWDSAMQGKGLETARAFVAQVRAGVAEEAAKAAQTPDQGADPAGEVGTSGPLSKEQMAKLDQIRNFLMSEAELEQAAYQEKMDFLASTSEEQFASAAERNTLIQGVEAEHQRAINQIAADAAEARKKLEQEKLKAQLSGASTFFSNMSSLMNTGSKRLFKIGQAAAIATTIVNTAQAAMAGFAVGMSNGGPWVAAAYAAAAIVAGAVQIANIRSASPGGGGSISSGGGAGVPSSGGSDPNSPNVGVNGGGTFGSGGQPINITVVGTSVDKSALIGLAEQLNSLRGDGVQIGEITFQ